MNDGEDNDNGNGDGRNDTEGFRAAFLWSATLDDPPSEQGDREQKNDHLRKADIDTETEEDQTQCDEDGGEDNMTFCKAPQGINEFLESLNHSMDCSARAHGKMVACRFQ